MVIGLRDVIDALKFVVDTVAKVSELDRRYFDTFVEPAWQAFVVVHRGYISSFKEYIDLLSQENSDIDAIIERIRQDSIGTSDARSELSAMVTNLPSDPKGTKIKYVSDFAWSIVEYFQLTGSELTDLWNGQLELPNMPRFEAIILLSRHPHDISGAKIAFDAIIRLLHSNYKGVANSYSKVRTELLR